MHWLIFVGVLFVGERKGYISFFRKLLDGSVCFSSVSLLQFLLRQIGWDFSCYWARWFFLQTERLRFVGTSGLVFDILSRSLTDRYSRDEVKSWKASSFLLTLRPNHNQVLVQILPFSESLFGIMYGARIASRSWLESESKLISIRIVVDEVVRFPRITEERWF